MKKIVHTLFSRILLIFSLCMFLPGIANAQKKWKDYLITGSAMFVSGIIDGTKESISYHYDRGFKKRLPKVNDEFWNPAISWKNKYKNGDCNQGPKFNGSTNLLVFTTDAYHLLRTSQRAIDGLTLAYYVNKKCSTTRSADKKWKNVAKDFLILTAIRCIGFNVTYNFVFAQQKNHMTN
ncbi:MAG: hypothetical protein ACXVNR_01640 [Bacteroidia bacterium]